MKRYVLPLFIVLELVGRYVGLIFPDMQKDTEKSRPSSYAGFHHLYGPYPIPGKFEVYFSNSWCKVTHNKDSNRITRPLDDTTDYSKKPKLNIYGCSFTWGSGLNDSSTYPYIIQSQMHQYNVQNMGVFAAGNLVALLQLRDEIQRNDKPDIAIVAYASFHDERNTFNREWATLIKESVKQDHSDGEQKASEAARQIDTIKFPQARLVNDSLKIDYKPLNGDLFPFSRYSVSCFLIHQLINVIDESKIHSNEVTRKIFLEMHQLCVHNGIRLIVTCIDDDQNTQAMQSYFKRNGIEHLNFGVNYLDKKYNLFPDEHPNEKADQIYATRIVEYLNKYPTPR